MSRKIPAAVAALIGAAVLAVLTLLPAQAAAPASPGQQPDLSFLLPHTTPQAPAPQDLDDYLLSQVAPPDTPTD
jgi:hypothetical protein